MKDNNSATSSSPWSLLRKFFGSNINHDENAMPKKPEVQISREESFQKKQRDHHLLTSITNTFNFDTGRYVANDKYAPIQELINKAGECDSLRARLGISAPKSDFENSSNKELWDLIGGRSEQKEGFLLDITQGNDIQAQSIGIGKLLDIRREFYPRVDALVYVKAVSELSARVKIDIDFSNKKLHEKLRRKYIRTIERQARWRMIRKLQPEKP